MASLVNAHKLSKGFAGKDLFQGLSFGITDNQHIGLIGPNGAGKSTLLKIILGTEDCDQGTVARKQGLRVAYLAQSPELAPEKSVIETMIEGALDPDDWEASAKAYEWFSKLGFEEAGLKDTQKITELSGGWRKKVAFVREIIREPDLLLLDEPTNHLDVESILWLEDFLKDAPFSVLTITHDRLFLNRIAKHIWELDRRHDGNLLCIEGDYATFCEIKDAQFSALEKQESSLKNTLRRETEWLRRGPAARSTKQVARINRAGDLAENVERLEDLNRKQNVSMAFADVEGTPKKLIEAKNVSKAYGEKKLFANFDWLMQRGSRLGLLGPNGAGKSTLIKIFLGLESPDTGEIIRADKLEVAYFDQNREELDPNETVLKSICPQGDHVFYRGRYQHVKSYLDKFLFKGEKVDRPVSLLSGGEQARLLLARLMLKDANLLVLDEPTNDLDLATLNVLEESLKEFPGAILIVSHDRYFLDQIADQVIVPYDGQIEVFSGVGQWETWYRGILQDKKNPGKASTVIKDSANNAATNAAVEPASAEVKGIKKLSYKDQRDLDSMASNMEALEKELSQLNEKMTSNEVTSNAQKLTELTQQMAEIQAKIDILYARWAELEALQSS